MNAKTYVTNQSLLDDLFGISDDENDESLPKNKEYYIDKAQEILCDITIDNYYEFLKHILVKFNDIDDVKRQELIKILKIPEVTKTVYKSVTKKKNKKKLNMDDY